MLNCVVNKVRQKMSFLKRQCEQYVMHSNGIYSKNYLNCFIGCQVPIFDFLIQKIMFAYESY